MAFYLDRRGVLRLREFEQWPWLLHGFGTRLAVGVGGAAGMKLVTLRQIHSAVTRLAGRRAPSGLKGDVLLTRRAGLLLGIRTADCLPVLLVDPRRRAVSAVHAGWRGIVRRVAEKGVGEMRLNFGSDPAGLHAAIGPGIRGCCFEVGPEVLQEFESQFGDAADYCRRETPDPALTMLPRQFLDGKSHALMRDLASDRGSIDLAAAVRSQLRAAGLDAARIYDSGRCTACGGRLFFSYRREKEAAGRMLAVIGVRPSRT